MLACWGCQPRKAPQASGIPLDACQGRRAEWLGWCDPRQFFPSPLVLELHGAIAPDGLFIMLNISDNWRLMLLSGSLDIIGLDNKSIFSLPYKVGKSNIQRILGECVCMGISQYIPRPSSTTLGLLFYSKDCHHFTTSNDYMPNSINSPRTGSVPVFKNILICIPGLYLQLSS